MCMWRRRVDTVLVLLLLLYWIGCGYVCGVRTVSVPNPVALLRKSPQHRTPEVISSPATERRGNAAGASCGRAVAVDASVGNITSPGYPDFYPNHLRCEWLLQASEGSTVQLQIIKLDLERSPRCEYDYLEIVVNPSGEARIVDRLCGTVEDKWFSVNASQVLLRFNTDAKFQHSGFLLQYNAYRPTDCEEFITSAKEGVVTSPRFPDNYPDNSDCWTFISASSNQVITVQFDILDMEEDEGCSFDYVELIDGRDKKGPSIGRFCSERQNEVVQSSSSKMWIHFRSDQVVSGKGFSAKYLTRDGTGYQLPKKRITACQWEKGERNGSVSSPNFPNQYPSNTRCVVTLEAPPNHLISLTFLILKLDTDVNCSTDRVELHDGFDEESTLLGRFCGLQETQQRVQSTSNALTLVFDSDDFTEYTGFNASYVFVSQAGPSTEETFFPEDVTPSLTTIMQNVTLFETSAHVFKCTSDNPRASISWYLDGLRLEENDLPPGVRLVKNDTLWIQNMTRILEGIYTCVAATSHGATIARARIKMAGSPTPCDIKFVRVPKDKKLSEGEYFYQGCQASSGAEVDTTWYKDGQELIPTRNLHMTSGFLVVNGVVENDTGVYSCTIQRLDSLCQLTVSALVDVAPRVKASEVCGRPKAGQPSKDDPALDDGRQKVIGGRDAAKGAYPWQAMLWTPENKTFCGGSLLNDRWVLTAAHCLTNNGVSRERVVVRLGKHDQFSQEPQEVATDIENVVVHPSYNKVTLDNDIALLRLRQRVAFSDYVLPVCVGDPKAIEDAFFEQKHSRLGIVTGWGQIVEHGPRPRFLQELRMPIVNAQTCKVSTSYDVTRNMFCAGYAQEIIGDACKGDSGSPFVVEHENRWYVVGVVSWGEGCAKQNKYGFYTRVTNYYNWITGIITV